MTSGLRRRAASGRAPRTWRGHGRCALLAIALGASGCGTGATVSRVMHGRTVEGPLVSDEAYAAYARGAYLEARGQRSAAIDAYNAALAADSSGAAIWTRLGALYCGEQPRAADDAFAEAVSLAPRYAPAWSSRAECHESRGQLDQALSDALRAVALDPDDTAANLLVASLYREQRRLPEAKAWLLALALRSPEPSAHWWALATVAEAAKDPALAREARRRLDEREARRDRIARPANDDAATSPPSELLDALREQDLPRARALAGQRRIDARALALLAAAHGQAALATQQANLVLAADPADPDALIAALVAAASAGDAEQLAGLVAGAEGERRPSALGARLLADLLRWFVSEEAAAAWTRAYGAGVLR